MAHLSPPTIEVQELDKLRTQQDSHLIVDVRESWEYEIAHIDPSLHVPLNMLPAKHHDFPSDRPLIIVCHHGIRSLKGCLFLREQGLDRAVSLSGGIDAWALLVDSSMRRY